MTSTFTIYSIFISCFKAPLGLSKIDSFYLNLSQTKNRNGNKVY